VSPQPIAELGRRAKAASRVLAVASTAAKDAALNAAADLLVQGTTGILEANADDDDVADMEMVTGDALAAELERYLREQRGD